MQAELIPFVVPEKASILERIEKEIAHGSHSIPDSFTTYFDEAFIQTQLTKLFKQLKKNYKITQAWVHVLGPGQSHSYHNHASAVGIIYLKVSDNSGDLVFDDQKITIRPIEDHFILVPAEEAHSTTENKSDHPRIVLAFSLEESN